MEELNKDELAAIREGRIADALESARARLPLSEAYRLVAAAQNT
jgi:hypothetical protein